MTELDRPLQNPHTAICFTPVVWIEMLERCTMRVEIVKEKIVKKRSHNRESRYFQMLPDVISIISCILQLKRSHS